MSATVRICTCVAAYGVGCECVFHCSSVFALSMCAPCIHVSRVRWADASLPGLCMRLCLFLHMCICARLNEWALSGAAPRCASRIWSHLCWGSVGGERMTLMYLNSRQTFLRHSSVWNQDNWAQSSWTGWSGLVSRRQTLWLHSNSWSDSPGSLRQTDTHKHWNLFVSMIETQCFISKGILFFSLAVRVLLATIHRIIWVYFPMCGNLSTTSVNPVCNLTCESSLSFIFKPENPTAQIEDYYQYFNSQGPG